MAREPFSGIIVTARKPKPKRQRSPEAEAAIAKLPRIIEMKTPIQIVREKQYQ